MLRHAALALTSIAVLVGCGSDESRSSSPATSAIADPAIDAQACFDAAKIQLLLVLDGSRSSTQGYEALAQIVGEQGAPVRAYQRNLPPASEAMSRKGESAAVAVVDEGVRTDCEAFTSEPSGRRASTSPTPRAASPSRSLASRPPSLAASSPSTQTGSDIRVPDLGEGCVAVLNTLAASLAARPDDTIRAMDALYGRAGEVVVGAAERAAEDPRLSSDPSAVVGEVCPPGY